LVQQQEKVMNRPHDGDFGLMILVVIQHPNCPGPIRLGLRPGGDNGTFLQRYPIRRTQIDTSGFVMVMGRGTMGHWVIGRDVALQGGTLPESTVTGPAVLMVGLPTDSVRPFGDVEAAIERELREAQSRVLFDRWIASLRDRAYVKVNDVSPN
jgi:hypothetical protein